MKIAHIVAWILLIVGGLNWALVGLFDGFDLVAKILGSGSSASNIVYILIGLSAILELFGHKRNCKACCDSRASSNSNQMP